MNMREMKRDLEDERDKLDDSNRRMTDKMERDSVSIMKSV